MRWSAGSAPVGRTLKPEGSAHGSGTSLHVHRRLGGADPRGGAATAADALKATIGQRGNWDSAIVHLGTKAGIFQKHGLQVEAIYTSGSGETLQPAIAGSVDIGIAAGTLAWRMAGPNRLSRRTPCRQAS